MQTTKTSVHGAINIDDLIRGMMLMMESPAGVTGPINFGNPREFTLLELAEKVIQKVGGRSKISFKPLPSDDPKQRRPDITRARTQFGWEPHVSLEDGLEPTVAYFRKLLGS